MPLNIKDDELHAKARELAALKGRTITAVVRDAIEGELAAARRAAAEPPPATAAELLSIARRIAQGFQAGEHSSDHADLYDEIGLPK